MLTADKMRELQGFVLELNKVSSGVILPFFRSGGDAGLENKAETGDYDPVTAADRGAEEAIRRLIAERYPEHGVIGEEHGEDRPDAEFVWVLDPIDGTRAFVAGIPMWTTLIGLRHHGRPVLGSIGQPFIGEIFIGHRGGSKLIDRNGELPLRTRKIEGLSTATIATTDPDTYFSPVERAGWTRVRKATRLARTGCDAYAYAMVARGFVDCVIESGLKAWDVEAAIPVLEGAGGVVTDWQGNAVGPTGGQIVFLGDPRRQGDVTSLLAGGA